MPGEVNKNVISSYHAQKETIDKIMFLAEYSNRTMMLQKGKVFPKGKRVELGFNKSGDLDPVDANTELALKNNLFNELVGEGSDEDKIENIREAFRLIAILQAKIKCDLGKEYERILEDLPDEYKVEVRQKKILYDKNMPEIKDYVFLDPEENQKIKEKKAAYLTYSGWSKESGLDRSIIDLETEFVDYIMGLDVFKKYLFDMSDYRPDMTFEELAIRTGLDAEDEQKLYEMYDVQKNDSLSEGITKKLQKLGNDNVKETDITNEIYDIVRKSFIASCEKQGRKWYFDCNTLREKELYDTGMDVMKNGEDTTLIKDWKNNEGLDVLSTMAKTNIVNNLIVENKKLSYGKPLNTIAKSGISEIYNNRLENNIDYLEAMLDELKATKTGESKYGWHKTNSKTYDNMLTSIKAYKNLVLCKSGGKADVAREKMVKCCLDYIKGKEAVRETDFGKKRFDCVMVILSKQLPEKDFSKLLKTINEKRKVTEKDMDYLSVDSFKKIEDKSVTEYNKIKNQKILDDQALSELDRTKVIKSCARDIEYVDDIYGLKDISDVSDKYDLSNVNINDIVSVKQDFVAIEPAGKEFKLSNKDFAAIAYACSLSPDAITNKNAFPELSKEDNVYGKAPSYTSGFDDIGNNHEGFVDIINYGKNEAKNSMEAYAEGDKEILAKNLSYGIKYIANVTRTNYKIDYINSMNNEMGKRMVDMIMRDPELYKISLSYGVKHEDICHIRSMAEAATIFYNREEGYKLLDKASSDNKELGKEEKIYIAENILLYDLLSTSLSIAHERLLKLSEYNDMKYIVDNDYGRKKMSEVRMLYKEAKSNKKMNGFNLSLDYKYDHIKGAKYIALKNKNYISVPVVENLYKKEELDKLKKRIRKLIHDKKLLDVPNDRFADAVERLRVNDIGDMINAHYNVNNTPVKPITKTVSVKTTNKKTNDKRVSVVPGRITKVIK